MSLSNSEVLLTWSIFWHDSMVGKKLKNLITFFKKYPMTNFWLFLNSCIKFKDLRSKYLPVYTLAKICLLIWYSSPCRRGRMKFLPHVKVKNSFPRGRRPQGEEFFTFTRGENSFLPTRLGKSSILMYFCNKLEGEKNLRKSFFFPIGIKKNLSFSLLRNFYVKSFIKKLTCREKEWIFFFPVGKKYKIFSL